MEENLLSNRDKWLRTLLVTLLGACAIEVFFIVLHLTTPGSENESVPWTFHSFWEIAALGGIASIVRRCAVRLEVYGIALLFGFFLSGLIWTFILGDPKVPQANYYGVESSVSMETPVYLGLLYGKDDPELKRNVHEAKRYNQSVGTREFLFWQTGLAYGFNPIGINGYNGGSGFLNRVELFFTVGPMVIVESFIMGLARWFPILMLAQIIFFLVKKEILMFLK